MKTISRIPCIYQDCGVPTNRLILYFHGNAEDAGQSEELFSSILELWRTDIITVEYPTYGVYTKGNLGEKPIFEDAEDVYNSLIQMGVQPKNIVIFGRSLGSGPATYLASKVESAGLILFAPYLSIGAVAKDIAGGFLSMFIKDRFVNRLSIQSVKCPTIIVHGKKDQVISYQHGEKLYGLCSAELKQFICPENMTHNNFQIRRDLVDPVAKFFRESGVWKQFSFEEKIDRQPFNKLKKDQ